MWRLIITYCNPCACLGRFVEPFREEVKWWEKTLTVVYESIDAILAVQKQWMYMEVCMLVQPVIVTKDTGSRLLYSVTGIG